MTETIQHCTSHAAQMDCQAPLGWRWVTVLAEDACDDCRDGVTVGHDHIECCAATLQRVQTEVRY